MGSSPPVGNSSTGPIQFDIDARCTGKIKMVAYSLDSQLGRVRYDRTTIRLDNVQRNFYTQISENRAPLHRAYFEGSTIRLHVSNCFTGLLEFHSFNIVKMR